MSISYSYDVEDPGFVNSDFAQLYDDLRESIADLHQGLQSVMSSRIRVLVQVLTPPAALAVFPVNGTGGKQTSE